MKRRLLIIAGFSLLPIILSGCAAIEARENDGPGRPYIGVRSGAYILAHPSQTDEVMLPLMAALDLPFSFVVDTICLPYDLVEARKSKKFDPRQNSTTGGE